MKLSNNLTSINVVNTSSITKSTIDSNSNPEIEQTKESSSKKDLLNITNSTQKGNAKLEINFLENVNEQNLIKKFSESPTPPYVKDLSCNLIMAVVENTSSINQLECSNILSKTPNQLAKDIFENKKIKEDPSLKEKVTNILNSFSSNDKMGLVSVLSLLDRNPPISDNSTKVILDKLSNMMNENYDSRVGDKKSFVLSALHDVSIPYDIAQKEIGTCAGTSVQIQLAIRNPIEYLNMIDKLAKNEPYTSVKGISIQPNFSFANEGGNNYDSKRTISAKIMQNTIMDYADGSERNYDSSKKDEALFSDQTAKALNDIVGVNVEENSMGNYTNTQLMSFLKKSNPSYENPIEISLAYQKEGRDLYHSVNVISLDKSNVTILNPWGREEIFPVSELEKRILSVSTPTSINKEIFDNNITSLTNSKEVTSILNNLSKDQKIEFIKQLAFNWDGKSYNIKEDMTKDEKLLVINILSDLTNGSLPQYKVIKEKFNHFNLDFNILLNKIDNNSDQFKMVKEKILAIIT